MLIGYQRIWDTLTGSASKNKLAHAYLFCGSSGTGKITLAKEFVKWLFCEKIKSQELSDGQPCGLCRSCQEIEKNNHPDLLMVLADKEEKSSEIGIGKIRTLQHQLSFYPYKSSLKVVIIEEAHNLTREAANAFLKTLEEPSSRSLIILTSSAGDSILPTILSRCQLIKFLPVPLGELKRGLEDLGAKGLVLDKIVKLSAGRPGYARNLLSKQTLLSEHEAHIKKLEDILKADLVFRFEAAKELSQDVYLAKEILSQWLLYLRDRLLEISGQAGLLIDEKNPSKINCSSSSLLLACREIIKAQDSLGNTSFNARLVLEVLLMKI